tara:strand:- start:2292 stop:3581 length:1290 start_codon:yes stop_codon:yes gene_type:complete
MKRNYTETLEWMYRQLPMYQRQGTSAFKKDLTNIFALCEGLGNPQHNLKYIHIAGTNGKGSVSHIIAGILQSQGYRVGMYTSPHYKDFRERIKINGEFISKRHVSTFINKHQALIEKIQPSFFEITVAIALDYFASEVPDFIVMEVGLGGRLDSTNIISPMLSVITNISHDHQSVLGNTLAEIAYEKGGIIKNNIPIIIGQHQDVTDSIFIKIANERKTKLLFAEDIINLSVTNENPIYRSLLIKAEDWNFEIKTDLLGNFQLKNIITAFAAVNWLTIQKEIVLDINKVIEKFKSLKADTYFIGRWQILNNKPLTIADSAHNEDGIKHLTDQLEDIEYNQLHIVLGTVNDKDVDKMLSLFPDQAKYYFCKANIPRGLDVHILQSIAEKTHKFGKAYRSVKQAFAAARVSADDKDLIIIAGSIFIVAEAI